MTTKNKSAEKTLVLGGTGKTGSRVASRLWDMGYTVRIASRKADIPFDWENPGTWKAVLKDMTSVYISFQPDLSVPGSQEAIQTLCNLAVESGVKKLVLLSGRGEPEAEQCEKVVMNAGVDWTIIRASWFFQNFSESHLLYPILAGHVALPVGDVGEPFIDTDDIADVAVAALTDEKHSNQLYEVTGPRLITFKEAIAEIAAASKKTIDYQQITIEEYTAMLEMHGVPQEYIKLLNYLFIVVLDGRNESLANGVQKALGRKPKDFSSYVKNVAAKGIWHQELAQK